MANVTLWTSEQHSVIGRTVGDGRNHTALVVRGERLLAVRKDGGEYVTWTFQQDGDQVRTFWGHYFLVSGTGPAAAGDAWAAALAELESRS